MKLYGKVIILTIIGFLLTAGILPSLAQPNQHTSEHKTIIVPDDYETIQEAINQSQNEDTIFVKKGTYHEQLTIDKQINLIGEDKTNTIIDAKNKYYSVITLDADYVFISGFSILNGKKGYHHAGIRGYSSRCKSNHTTITNCIIKNNGDGITAVGNNLTITQTIFQNNTNGINLFHSNNNTIQHNTFYHDGIILSASYNQNINNNTVNEKPLIYRENKENQHITEKAGQIILNKCKNITIQHQTISNVTTGIFIYRSYECTITNNTFSKNNKALYLSGTWLCKINNNTLTNNTYGIYQQSGQKNIIRQNNIKYNTLGIYAEGFTNTIIKNHIHNNKYGLNVTLGPHTITKNNFIDNENNGYFSRFIIDDQIIWNANYWETSTNQPYIIKGELWILSSELPLPWINIDWQPAQHPYKIVI